jgi:hypothetical protein
VIVLVSHTGDVHAPPVLAALKARGAAVALVDTSAFPQRSALRMRYGPGGACDLVLEQADGPTVRARDVEAVWWRRPLPVEVHPAVTHPDHRRFAWEECDDALWGFWLALDARWVNHPSRYLAASRKPFQLRAAQAAGLAVPRTLVTNDPGEVRHFAEELGDRRVVFKSFTGSAPRHWETRFLRREELDQVDAVKYAPLIFQEYVPGYDVRATVVGGRIFAARIDARETAYPLDWRVDVQHTRIEPLELPPQIAERLRRLHRDLGLAYGACDLRVTPDGEYVFLEVNPAGQWLFVEHATGLPISACIADLLMGREAGRETGREAGRG